EARGTTANRIVQVGIPLGWCLLLLLPTTVLMKSIGALALGLLGWGVLCLSKTWPSRIWLILLITVPPTYAAARITGVWAGEGLIDIAKLAVGQERAHSLEFRLQNEELLIQRALERPVFGWGGWGRNRISDDHGRDITVTDGLWIMA